MASSKAKSRSRACRRSLLSCCRPPWPSTTTWTSCEWRLQAGEHVTITDVTDDYGVLVLAGPQARDVLAPVHHDTISPTPRFRWLTGKDRRSRWRARACALLRVNYVGELGWELHVPMASMPKVFDALMAAGEAHGIQLFGTYAMNSLRMEKAYRGWGAELTNEVTMFEADMERFVNFRQGIHRQGRHAQVQAGRSAHRAHLPRGRLRISRLPGQ